MLRNRTLSTAARLDVAGSAILCAAGQLEIWASWGLAGIGTHDSGAPRVIRSALVIAATAPLIWRRRKPLLTSTVIVVALGLQVAVLTPSVSLLAGLLPLLVATFSVAAHGVRLNRVAGLALALIAQASFSIAIPEERVPNEILFGVFVIVGSWLLGLALSRRLRGVDLALIDIHRQAEQQRDLAARIVADERARIARELHDVIAHGVSVMGVQCAAARLTLDRDPDAAKLLLSAVEDQARESIEELQRLLRVLRDSDGAPDLSPQPGLDDLPRLVNAVRGAGLHVALTEHGAGPRLPAGIDLAAYRIVQEALTNTMKHAGAVAVRVDIDRSADELRIRVCDDGPPVTHEVVGGHGLTGMRERVALYGGSVWLRTPPTGGTTVEARIPVQVVVR